MARCDKIEKKARRSRSNLRFSDLCYLADCYGYRLIRQSGSHRIYARDADRTMLNLQPLKDGKAKPYQVGQVLDAAPD